MTQPEPSPASSATSSQPHHRPIAPAPDRVFNSHQVNSNHSITFRADAPNAKTVELVSDITDDIVPLTRGPDGLWTVTTSPLPPGLYSYAFSVDGVDQPDPRNSLPKPSLILGASMVLVPGEPAKLWEPADLPHGVVHSHVYTTDSVEGLPANQSRYVVYTPPAYDPESTASYPVLCLLHGWSDSEIAWTQIGQAHLILDALIASGKAKPMVVIMPLGYGQMSFVETGIQVWENPAAITASVMRFQRALLSEILPQVEPIYNVRRDRESRAIAGLSMGGAEATVTGLNHLDKFAWIGSFSGAYVMWPGARGPAPATPPASGGRGGGRGPSSLDAGAFAKNFPSLDAKANAQIRLLWVACGTADGLIGVNRQFKGWLDSKDVKVTYIEVPEMAHVWPLWRQNLTDLAPLLFQAGR